MSHGRRIIYTDETLITAANVVAEVNKANLVHINNRQDIQGLYDYYKGITPIELKEKEIRPEINHKVCENIAYEIVTFHKGYGFGEEIQLIRRENSRHTPAGKHSEEDNARDDKTAADINSVNAYLADADKHACDIEIAEWMLIAGLGYRYTTSVKQEDTPVRVVALDPRQTYVVYSSNVGHDPMMGVTYVEQANGTTVYTVYTTDSIFQFSTGVASSQGVVGVKVAKNPLAPFIPIVEYPANRARLGCFEPAIPLLDSINELQSNRMDDIVQHVNSFLAILGGEVDDDTYKKIMEWKMLCLPEGTDAKYLSDVMSETDLQKLKDDLRQAVLTICSMPNRNGGSSTSDTGVAVVYRDGWEAAESYAKGLELMFKKAEKVFLRIVLMILRDKVGIELTMADIESHFNRRNYANMQTKAQILVSLLGCEKVHPELAFVYSDIDPDPQGAYLLSKAYYEEVQAKNEQLARENANSGADQVSSVQPKTNGSNRQGNDQVS